MTRAVERGDISLTVTATGNLEPTNEVTVGSEAFRHHARRSMWTSNDRVTKGQPLAKLDTRKLSPADGEQPRRRRTPAKAKVSQAQATVMEIEAVAGRAQELHQLSGGKAPSRRRTWTPPIAVADRARADLLSAKAAVDEAQAQLDANETDLAKATIIRSPIDGIVLKRSLEPGQTVAASFTAPELFIIAENLEHMKLKVAVAEADIGRVAAGPEGDFTVDAWPERQLQRQGHASVSFGSAVTDNVVTYETELEVANEDLSLRPGMTATADIRVAESRGRAARADGGAAL